jgi:1-deoxy-D-xylulose-5-phosphate reductoisomerase
LNASNEVAVAAFLEHRIGFRDIHRIIEKTMQAHVSKHPKDVQEILEVDRWARQRASSLIH